MRAARFLTLIFSLLNLSLTAYSAPQIDPSLTPAQVANVEKIAGELGDVFEKVMRASSPPAPAVLKRPVFAKAHGCLKARFDVNANLPAALRVGAFTKRTYPAWIRFSNDGSPRPDSSAAARGMSFKLVGVSGTKILEGEESAVTQDFVMQNYPVFFTNNAKDFLDFIFASLSRNPNAIKVYNQQHPETAPILDAIDKQVLADPLDGTYWTPTPYRLGRHAIKYMVKPCTPPPPPTSKPMTHPDFLRRNLAEHIQRANGCFDFFVQLHTNNAEMPLDRATVPWSERRSPFRHVGRLTIPKGQDVDDPTREALCENLSFTGWHSLPEHAPLGSINLARKFVYKRIADARRERNQAPLKEPTTVD